MYFFLKPEYPWDAVTFEKNNLKILHEQALTQVCDGLLLCDSVDSDLQAKRPVNLFVKLGREDKTNGNREQVLFMRQVEILTHVRHSCVVRLYSFSLQRFGMALEWYPTTLSNIFDELATKGKYALDDFVWNHLRRAMAIVGIAAGMCALHDKNIVHRDLKPEHILIDRELKVHIAGMRTARVLSYEAGVFDVCEGWSNDCGTWLYMSPESFRGDPLFGKPSDIYAYAMIVYFITIGRVRWVTDDPEKDKVLDDMKLRKLVLDKTRPVVEHVPANYRSLIEKCWTDSPEERPSFRTILSMFKNGFLWTPDFSEADKQVLDDYYKSVVDELGEPPREND
jgi:serine/threonine protein kinase